MAGIPRNHGLALFAAALTAMLLHAFALGWLPPRASVATRVSFDRPLRMRVVAPTPAPQAAAVMQAPAPPAPQVRRRPRPAPASEPITPSAPAAIAPQPDPAPATTPQRDPLTSSIETSATSSTDETPSNLLYVAASLADVPPAPLADWVLPGERWPDGVRAVQLTLWIDAEGRIERHQLLGAAADDTRVQALFADIDQTPMRAAQVGAGTAPSVMTVEIWQDDVGDLRPRALTPQTQPSAAATP